MQMSASQMILGWRGARRMRGEVALTCNGGIGKDARLLELKLVVELAVGRRRFLIRAEIESVLLIQVIDTFHGDLLSVVRTMVSSGRMFGHGGGSCGN